MLSGAVSNLPLEGTDRLNLLFAPVQGEQQLALAVSGGVDSLSLMLLVARWTAQHDNPPQIVVFTVNHGLRKAAKTETEFVASLASELGFEAHILKGEIKDPESRLQEKARELRYQLIGEAMDQQGITCLLTGHHSDDQAETVLMRLAKGSGVSGLGGMARISVRQGLFVFRPFLEVRRTELEEFIARQDANAVDDPSNQNKKFERVRWRQFMPQLNEVGLSSEMIGMSAMRLRRADQALNALTERIYDELFVIDPFGCLFFDLADLNKQPAEIAIRLLARALDDAGGEGQMPTLLQVEALFEHFQSGVFAFKGLTLGGCGIKVKDGIGQIYREAGRLSDAAITVQPGHSTRWDNRFQIIAAPDLTSPLCVVPAIEITRNLLENMLPGLPYVPMQAVQSTPLVFVDDQIMALGEHVLAEGVDVFRSFGPNALI